MFLTGMLMQTHETCVCSHIQAAWTIHGGKEIILKRKALNKRTGAGRAFVHTVCAPSIWRNPLVWVYSVYMSVCRRAQIDIYLPRVFALFMYASIYDQYSNSSPKVGPGRTSTGTNSVAAFLGNKLDFEDPGW